VTSASIQPSNSSCSVGSSLGLPALQSSSGGTCQPHNLGSQFLRINPPQSSSLPPNPRTIPHHTYRARWRDTGIGVGVDIEIYMNMQMQIQVHCLVLENTDYLLKDPKSLSPAFSGEHFSWGSFCQLPTYIWFGRSTVWLQNCLRLLSRALTARGGSA
jgi:hypothetical protein